MSKDYYNVLGVDRNSNQDEIKRAFRKKAHQYHPDKKDGDETKFKEVSEAYQVLSNAEKRQQYDQFGTTFDQGQGGFSGFDFNQGFQGFDFSNFGDIFEGMFGGFTGGRRRAGPVRGSDIQTELELNFREAVFGTDKTIELYKTDKCDHCQGNGAEPGTKIITCSTCGGSGQVASVQRTVLGNFQTVKTCSDCRGEGKKAEQACSKCQGRGIIKAGKKIKVKIPAGIDKGEVIRISGEGQAGLRGGPNGDLYIEARVKPDPEFKRTGQDIISKIKLSFPLAALGGKIKTDTLHGEVMLKIPAGIQSGQTIKLKGKGVPKLHGSGHGDHLVKVEVTTPEKLSAKGKKLL
ncbi:MAG TPA: molecular chaperone DnaJ, partial [Patescibacteria group bacterium]